MSAFVPVALPFTAKPRLHVRARRATIAPSVCRASAAGGSAYAKPTMIPADPSDDAFAAALMPLYVADRDRFMRAVVRVKQLNRHTAPLFPPVDVSAVPPVPASEADAFRAAHLSTEYIKWGTDEADKRTRNNGRPLQYRRWRWACDNIDTFVNMLRQYGHADDAIERMFAGTPLCFPTQADFDRLRGALKGLAAEVADEFGWANVGFVVTGSSVPGFSQNPLKGLPDLPSKITDPAESDVDICIVADGVNATVADRRSEGMEENEPKYGFPTTMSEMSCGMRFGCKDVSQFSKAVGKFHQTWSEILPGGLQLTFCEDDADIPPWEARVELDDL